MGCRQSVLDLLCEGREGSSEVIVAKSSAEREDVQPPDGGDDEEVSPRPREVVQLASEEDMAMLRLHAWMKPRAEKRLGATLDLSPLGLKEVHEVVLGHCDIGRLPPEIGFLSVLTRLDLRENWLRSLPPEIGQLKVLRCLILKDNVLTALPAEIGQLTKLQELWLEKNQLASIPPETGQLVALKYFLLQDNLLKGLPGELGRMRKLELLYLNRNQLASVPRELGQLVALEMLYLQDNRLVELPPELKGLAFLKKLDLSRNKLKSAPAWLNSLRSLDHFSIAENGIEGQFGLLPLFERLAPLRSAVVSFSGNRFGPMDFGDGVYSPPRIHDPVVNDPKRCSLCVASFCGHEFLDWQLLRLRTIEDPLWCHLCTFLPGYLEACGRDKAPADWHVDDPGGQMCQAWGKYFEAANEFTGGKSSEAHARFGCCWFQRWASAVDVALERGHRRFLVFTRADRSLGPCQAVEWLYLLQARQRVEGLLLHCVSAGDAMQVLANGNEPAAWEGKHAFPECNIRSFPKPPGLPGTLSPALEMALRW